MTAEILAKWTELCDRLNKLCGTKDVFISLGHGDDLSLLAGPETAEGEVDKVANEFVKHCPYYIDRRCRTNGLEGDVWCVDLRHVRHYGD